MSQSHPTLMQYLKAAHGGDTATVRLVPSPIGETSPTYTASPSRPAF
jgi:hypothetical protein